MTSRCLPGSLSPSGETGQLPLLAGELMAWAMRFAHLPLILSSWGMRECFPAEIITLWLSKELLLCARGCVRFQGHCRGQDRHSVGGGVVLGRNRQEIREQSP